VQKLLVAAVAAAIAVAGFAVFAFAGTGVQGSSWEGTAKPNKVNKPASLKAVLEPLKRDTKGTADESDDHVTGTRNQVIKLAKGSAIDTAAKARCKESPSDVQSGRAKCPSKTRIGEGEANTLAGQPDEGGGTAIAAEITAFNLKKGIMLVVDPCSPGPPATGPGTGKPCDPIPAARIVLVGDWSKTDSQPTLTVQTPPALVQGGVHIRRFVLTVTKIVKEKTVLVNGERKTLEVAYLTTPDTCKGNWKTQAVITYQDGSKQTITDTQKCVKP
jgi:hypothetical protein